MKIFQSSPPSAVGVALKRPMKAHFSLVLSFPFRTNVAASTPSETKVTSQPVCAKVTDPSNPLPDVDGFKTTVAESLSPFFWSTTSPCHVPTMSYTGGAR